MILRKRRWDTASGTHFVEYTVSLGGTAGEKGVPFVQSSILEAELRIKFHRQHMARRLMQYRKTVRGRLAEHQHRETVRQQEKRK
jgi:hypothetical protein